MISNKKTGPGSIYVEVLESANVNTESTEAEELPRFGNALQVHLLDQQEVPSLSTLPTDYIAVNPRVHYHRYVSIEEIENQQEVLRYYHFAEVPSSYWANFR